LAVAAAFMLAASMPMSVAAQEVVAGDLIKLYDGPGSPGGEFNIDNLTNGAGVDFVSFCVEKNEFISFGTTYTVGAVTNGAVNGGVAGGNPDPISFATALLYSEYRAGTLASYVYVGTPVARAASANSLQNAIWVLEDEQVGGLDAQAATWAAYGLANGTSLYGVGVINLVQDFGGGEYMDAQDQLTMIPEPETYAMLLAGLGLMGFVARRRQKKVSAA